MFYLSQLEHKLRLPPHLHYNPLDVAIKSELESLFLDKIIPKLGLFVSIYSIKDIQGGFVLARDDAPTYKIMLISTLKKDWLALAPLLEDGRQWVREDLAKDSTSLDTRFLEEGKLI